MPGRWRAAAAGAVIAAAGLLSACSPAAGEPAKFSVVTSTDVYAAIVQPLLVGLPRGRAAVTPIISDPSVDPHEFVASARTALAISRADIVVENGGGYDDFMDTVRSAVDSSVPVIDAVALSSYAHDPDLNEHVWYDLDTVVRFVRQFVLAVHRVDPKDAPVVGQNAMEFTAALYRLERTEERIRAVYSGADVAITEPVPLYLLQACGLDNRTPAEFSNAIEEGTDASPRVLQDMLDLFRDHQVQLLVYNAQTAGPQTDEVIDAARSSGVPVIGVTETLPADVDYLTWIGRILRRVSAALA